MTFVAPSFVSDASTLRTPGYSDRVFMSVFRGAVVCSGSVTATNANDTADVAISVTGGSISDVAYGQEVLIFNSNGDFRLRTHIRMAGTISSGNLPIREISYGTAQITSGDTFQVLQEWRMHDRLVSALSTFPPDHLTYSNQGTDPDPQCNSGGHWAGQVDDGQTFATVQMTGSTSFIVNPTSNPTHFAHLWTLPSGVAFQSGSASTDADPVLEVNQGSYVVRHDYTDSDASVTSTQYITLQCADLGHPQYQVFLTSPLQADENYVWHYTARLFNDATLTDIPDGSLVVLWTRERINNQWQSFRNATPGRETILAVGYLYADKSTLDAPLNTVTFDVISPLQRLDEVAGYSKVMEESATPDAWSKIKTLTTSRAMIQLLAYYTTLSLAGFDVLFDATCNNYTYPELYLQRSTPLQQVRELAHGVDARFIADRTGMFNIHTHPKYVPLADRSGIAVTFDIAKSDIIHAEFSRNHYNTNELVKTSGFSSGTSPQPLFSLYPGVAPGEAVNAPTVDRLICAAGSSGQGDLNERTGRYGADIDQVFIDTAGAWHRAFTLTLILKPQYDFFDFYLSYITLTLDGSSNLRGVDLSAFRYWVKSTQITYNAQGYPQLQVALQAETNAPAGTTYIPPDTSANGLPPINFPSLPSLTYAADPAVLGKSTARFALFDTGGGIWITHDGLTSAASGGPTWIYYPMAWDGTLMSFVVDAYSPLYLGTGATVNGWLVTTTKLYRITDIGGATGSPRALTVRHTFNTGLPSTSPLRLLDASFGVQNFVLCASYYANDATYPGVWVTQTSDDSTYTEVQVSDKYDTSGTLKQVAGIYVSSKTAGLAYCQALTTTGGGVGALGKLFKSPDYGVSWGNENAAPTTDLVGLEGQLFVPFAGSEFTVYWTVFNGGSFVDLYRTIGTAQTLLSANTAPIQNRGLAIHPLNANRAILAGAVASVTGVFTTLNLNSATPTFTQVSTDGYAHVYTAGNDQNTFYLLGVNLFALTSDFGATIDSKLGNLSTSGDLVGLCGI